MKILLINNYFGPHGGAENSTYRTGSVLKEKGHEVYYFASDKKPLWEEDYEYKSFFPKFEVSPIERFIRPYYNFSAEQNLDKYLKKIKPDIVHLNNIFYLLSPSIINACFKNKIPTIITLRDAGFICPANLLVKGNQEYCAENLCAIQNPIHCVLNKCINNNFLSSFRYASVFMLYQYLNPYNKINKVICTSNATYDLALKFKINQKKLEIINNFIDNSYFKNQYNYEEKGYFLYTGRLSKEKGIYYLIEAFRKLPEIDLHIVGSGVEESNLKNYVYNNNLQNIKILGHKSGESLKNEYKYCLATIVPSNWFETFGLSSVESFAYGKPVIGSNIGGIPEIVEDNYTGLIFERGNIDQLVEAIKKLYSDKGLAKELGKNARNKAEQLYTPEVYYSKLIRVYNSVLS